MTYEDNYEKDFSIVNRAIRQQLTQRLKPYDLSENNFMLVLLICEDPGITQDTLNRKIYREHSIVTKAVKRLADHGWCTIELDEHDKRRKQLYPTDLARKNYAGIRAAALAANHWLSNQLSQTEGQQLAAILNKLTKQLN